MNLFIDCDFQIISCGSEAVGTTDLDEAGLRALAKFDERSSEMAQMCILAHVDRKELRRLLELSQRAVDLHSQTTLVFNHADETGLISFQFSDHQTLPKQKWVSAEQAYEGLLSLTEESAELSSLNEIFSGRLI